MKDIILPCRCELVALDPARNIWRRYTITTSIDLFGIVIVESRWGGIGTYGKAKLRAFGDCAAAERYITTNLRRRGTAQKRIGLPYRRVASCQIEQDLT